MPTFTIANPPANAGVWRVRLKGPGAPFPTAKLNESITLDVPQDSSLISDVFTAAPEYAGLDEFRVDHVNLRPNGRYVADYDSRTFHEAGSGSRLVKWVVGGAAVIGGIYLLGHKRR